MAALDLPDPAALDLVPLDQLPAVLVRLAALQAAVGARLVMVPIVPTSAPSAGDDDELLDDQAVGKLLGVPASHIADLRRRDELPEVRVGDKYVRVRRGDVHEYVARRRTPIANVAARHV